jgi:hypothetical protein
MKKIIPLILSTLLLTSCSGPDSSGGVEFSKTDNAFPMGSCWGPGYQTHSFEMHHPQLGGSGLERTWCGWITANERSYYIKPWGDLIGADLRNADLSNADLSFANLNNAHLNYANLTNANLSAATATRANLSFANLTNANLNYANLAIADLSGATLTGVQANSSTMCPNVRIWHTAHNNCPF